MSNIEDVKTQIKQLMLLLVENQSDIDISITYLLGPYSYDDEIIDSDLPYEHKTEILKLKEKASYISGKINALTFVLDMLESNPEVH